MGSLGLGPGPSGPGWATCESGDVGRSAFTHLGLEAPDLVSGAGVNELAQRLEEAFSSGIRGERIEGPWPCFFDGRQEAVGLGRRVASVEKAFHTLLRRKLGRVERLSRPDRPRIGPARGFFVWFTDFGEAYASCSALMNGQRRMADDDAAPSRSYLKVEEAYGLVGAEPVPGESVCDLGAAPGGWSYSAAKRGARVVAVDNGPLKGGALGNPLVEHRQADAFGFRPEAGAAFDWLFCDMLEDPRRILTSIVRPWLSEGWCRRFIINLKFGRVDPVELLAELRGGDSAFARFGTGVRITHLYHDREELTVTGMTK
jgi:23S rRNA (cytidine2498-2'-O)-methyltransferase